MDRHGAVEVEGFEDFAGVVLLVGGFVAFHVGLCFDCLGKRNWLGW